MKNFKSLDELLAHWGPQADKYAALNRLHEDYEEQRHIIEEPYQQKLLVYAEQHGAASITVQVRYTLSSEIRDDMKQLRDWYGKMTKGVIDHFDKKNAN